jgi:hypothetical protein
MPINVKAGLHSNRWIRITIVGVLYFVIGYGSTFFDAPGPGLHFTRLAAWVASAAVYMVHLAYEHFRLESPPASGALNVGLAVAVGGFLLAIAAIVHAAMVNQHAPYQRFVLALVAWPLITGLPAFLVAFVAAVVLRWLKSPAKATT